MSDLSERDYDYENASDMQCGEEEPHYWHYWESDLDVIYWCFGIYE